MCNPAQRVQLGAVSRCCPASMGASLHSHEHPPTWPGTVVTENLIFVLPLGVSSPRSRRHGFKIAGRKLNQRPRVESSMKKPWLSGPLRQNTSFCLPESANNTEKTN